MPAETSSTSRSLVCKDRHKSPEYDIDDDLSLDPQPCWAALNSSSDKPLYGRDRGIEKSSLSKTYTISKFAPTSLWSMPQITGWDHCAASLKNVSQLDCTKGQYPFAPKYNTQVALNFATMPPVRTYLASQPFNPRRVMPCFSNLDYPSRGNNLTVKSAQTTQRMRSQNCATFLPNLCRLLALLLALAVAAPVLQAQDWDQINGRDKVHDPTGA